MISCQTRIIVIDDLHIIDFKHRAGVEVSNDLKWLANEMPVTFIFTGVQLAEKRFFDEGMLGEQAVRDTLSHSYVCSIISRVVGNIIVSVVYVFLVRALLRGRSRALRRGGGRPGAARAHRPADRAGGPLRVPARLRSGWMASTLSLAALRRRRVCSMSSVMTGRRPPWLPLRAAASRPSTVASRMFSRSVSAIAAKNPNRIRPGPLGS